MGVSTFASQALSEFQSTASIMPSSPYLVRAMVSPLELSSARLVVEFGPGTGVMTKALLESMPRDSKLLAFEINPRFIRYLRREFTDRRLEVVDASAELAHEAITDRGYGLADAALSSLGLSMLPLKTNARIIRGASRLLKPGATLTQYQYFSRLRLNDGRPEPFDASRMIRRHFDHVDRRMIVRNIPPAFVYAARKEG